MTIFGKWTKLFSSNKVVSKFVFTRIVISTSQLAKLIKTINKSNKMGEFVTLILLRKADELITEN